MTPLPFATGDDPAHCNLCGKDTSIAMLAHHLTTEHDVDLDDIASAEIIDATDEEAVS